MPFALLLLSVWNYYEQYYLPRNVGKSEYDIYKS